MLDAIASHESFDKISDKITNIETEVAKQAFSNIVNQVNTVKSQGDVMLTNVVFHDAYTEIASKADIVLVASTGQL